MFLHSGSRDLVLCKLAEERIANLETAVEPKSEDFPASWQELTMSHLRYFQQHRLSERLISISEATPGSDTQEAFAIMRRNIRASLDKSLGKMIQECGLPKRIGVIINRKGYSDSQAIEALFIQAAYYKILGECENKDYASPIQECFEQAVKRNAYQAHAMLALEYMQGDLFEKSIKKATASFCNALKAINNSSLTADEFIKHLLFVVNFKERLRLEKSADVPLMLSIIATTEKTLAKEKSTVTLNCP
jgi:hypothetical protein